MFGASKSRSAILVTRRSKTIADAVLFLFGAGVTSENSVKGSNQLCTPQDLLTNVKVGHSGQGGRPETGFNNCLHLRYARIARSLGCDSYWIDTTCIPNDHQLRAESISKINEVFMNAKVMLVCDKDIMDIDISNMTTEVCETLLVTAIVCDWNVRAWTFFEAFRARRTIHLLCRNNAVVPLKQVIEVIHREGALDVAILLLAMPHFLPTFDDRELAWEDSEGRQGFKAGYLDIETSGSLLSHRAASREGDDVVIWSLLMSEKTIFYNAEAFWKSMQGLAFQTSAKTGDIFSSAAGIKLGYLISSAPRLKTKGLGWAPASPAFRVSTESEPYNLGRFDGGLSGFGWITVDGLVADWWLRKIDGTSFRSRANYMAARLRKQSPESQCPRNLARIREKYLQGYRWGAVLWPMHNHEFREWWEDGSGWNDGSGWRNGSGLRRTILVVCATNETEGLVVEKYSKIRGGWDEKKEVAGWEWRGVYTWDDAEPLPQFRKAEKLLIV